MASEKRGDLAELLRRVMGRFRAGVYVFTGKRIARPRPPWKRLCPADALYCQGAILPGDCPRHWRECVYSQIDWEKIYKLRGENEINSVQVVDGNNLRGNQRPLIGGPSPRS
jgi:hypothetical protein